MHIGYLGDVVISESYKHIDLIPEDGSSINFLSFRIREAFFTPLGLISR